MRKLTTILGRSNLGKTGLLLLLSAAVVSCETEIQPEPGLETANASVNSFNTVKVTSTGMNFDAPDEIPAGWTSFSFMNKTPNVHFFVIQDLPEGKTLADSKREVVPYFQAGMNYWRDGDAANAFGAEGFGGLPAWYGEVVMTGGPGLVSGGLTATSSVHLDPGTYVIECYVKGRDGNFHSFHGMIDQFIVTGDPEENSEPPKVDIPISIGTRDGIVLEKVPSRPGRHTFSVHYIDQAAYGNLLGHDVHLVRIEDSVTEEDLEVLNKWMNWFYVGEDMEGFMVPSPEGFTFLGGLQELPAGQTGYFTAVLKPGHYALISEIDNPMAINHEDPNRAKMYLEFEIQ